MYQSISLLGRVTHPFLKVVFLDGYGIPWLQAYTAIFGQFLVHHFFYNHPIIYRDNEAWKKQPANERVQDSGRFCT